MAQSTFCLAWESHKSNICNGLSTLQQTGEFVDMTLAADGHHVKVHQMVIALASPYLKELISSANCPHPVIFLNKISYTTLSAILEYIYTGEVVIAVENIAALMQAARELHIKGLKDMDVQDSFKTNKQFLERSTVKEDRNMDTVEDDICYFEICKSKENAENDNLNYTVIEEGIAEDANSVDSNTECVEIEEEKPVIDMNSKSTTQDGPDKSSLQNIAQYTVSNQGSLQIILNRYVYYLKHSNKDNSRQWRCVDYLNSCKCPALVFTKDDVVMQRIAAHTHPFHDKRILKKVSAGAVFTAIQEAERQRLHIKKESKSKKSE